MDQKKIVGRRIAELRKERGEEQADIAAVTDRGRSTVAGWESGNAMPGRLALAKMAAHFGVSIDYLHSPFATEGAPQASGRPFPNEVRIENVMVRGVVQAGLWSPATEWEPDDWYPLAVPTDPRYPGARRFGLEVRGNSMNLVYPQGTVVIAVSFFEIDEQPRDQQHVVVVRRNGSGEFEATLKQFRVDEQGRRILWPRSTDPEHQGPIILPHSLGLSEDQDGFMIPGYSPPDTHGAGVTDLEITALVIGSFRPE